MASGVFNIKGATVKIGTAGTHGVQPVAGTAIGHVIESLSWEGNSELRECLNANNTPYKTVDVVTRNFKATMEVEMMTGSAFPAFDSARVGLEIDNTTDTGDAGNGFYFLGNVHVGISGKVDSDPKGKAMMTITAETTDGVFVVRNSKA